MEECYPGIDESREIGRWRWAGEGVAADRGGEARAEGGACSGESGEDGRKREVDRRECGRIMGAGQRARGEPERGKDGRR